MALGVVLVIPVETGVKPYQVTAGHGGPPSAWGWRFVAAKIEPYLDAAGLLGQGLVLAVAMGMLQG